jgi:hypothetical protein
MNTIVRNALVRLFADPPAPGAVDWGIPNQTVAVHRSDPQAIIGIDGHTGFWDELVEVRWEGAHVNRLQGIGRVEIQDRNGRLIESLPVDPTRSPREEDGETVFFLIDAE